MVLSVRQASPRERDNRLRTLRATRAHTLGYIGGCDQEQGRSNRACQLKKNLHHGAVREAGLAEDLHPEPPDLQQPDPDQRRLIAEEGTGQKVLKTFTLKMTQVKAGIWP